MKSVRPIAEQFGLDKDAGNNGRALASETGRLEQTRDKIQNTFMREPPRSEAGSLILLGRRFVLH
jgi:hypothetical protein